MTEPNCLLKALKYVTRSHGGFWSKFPNIIINIFISYSEIKIFLMPIIFFLHRVIPWLAMQIAKRS